MKHCFFGVLFLFCFFLQSCSKAKTSSSILYVDIDTTLIYGKTFEEYKLNYWPTFTENTNSQVNVLLEKFIGHRCSNCAIANALALNIQATDPKRIFLTSIHANHTGAVGVDQNYDYAPFTTNFTNPSGIEIAVNLWAIDTNFNCNPAGVTNRKRINSIMFNMPTDWLENTTNILNNNVLKVNLQSKSNYFPETRGVILHTEVDLLTPAISELYQVVYVIEDSLISPQRLVDMDDLNYVHRDIMRGCIDENPMGRKLTGAMKVDKNGNSVSGDKYYLNYSYKLPVQYDVNNMHFLIYVYDKLTLEILQVIRQKVKG